MSSQYWHAVTLTVPSDAVEAVNHRLFELGSLGTVEETIRPNAKGQITLKAYFSTTDFTASRLQSLLRYALESYEAIFPQTGTSPLDIAPLGFNDWGENWKQYFKPFYIAPALLVSPSWETPEVQPGDTLILLDPGMAFGTGLHATTQLCTQMLAQELKRNPAAAVLDVGCGSGILSIVAAHLGADPVVACDIDSQALDASRENIDLNHVTNISLIANIEEAPSTYPIIVANILLSTLLELKNLLLEKLAPGGSLILSGVLEEQEKLLLDGFTSPTLQCVRKEYQEEWGCYIFS